MTGATAVVSFSHVSKQFKGTGMRTALEDVSFSVDQGSFVVVAGPNGSGKSTLLRLAVGILLPSDGRVRVLGEAPRASNHRRAFVADAVHFRSRMTPSRVARSVLPGRYRHEALADLDHLGLLEVPMTNLSRGQLAQLLLVIALVGNPVVAALDEWEAHLDSHATDYFRQKLTRLVQRGGVVLASTQDPTRLRGLATSGLQLDGGRIAEVSGTEVGST